MSKKIEREYKFRIYNVNKFLNKIDSYLKDKGFIEYAFSTMFIIDKIFGKKESKEKIRVRDIKTLEKFKSFRTIEKVNWVKKGTKSEERLKEIPKGYKLENSYNKIRYSLFIENSYIMIDFYTIGVFCEIEGETEKKVKKISKKLGFNPKDRIKEGIDKIFCNIMKEKNIQPPLHWGF